LYQQHVIEVLDISKTILTDMESMIILRHSSQQQDHDHPSDLSGNEIGGLRSLIVLLVGWEQLNATDNLQPVTWEMVFHSGKEISARNMTLQKLLANNGISSVVSACFLKDGTEQQPIADLDPEQQYWERGEQPPSQVFGKQCAAKPHALFIAVSAMMGSWR
jgi:hypothetical protein